MIITKLNTTYYIWKNKNERYGVQHKNLLRALYTYFNSDLPLYSDKIPETETIIFETEIKFTTYTSFIESYPELFI